MLRVFIGYDRRMPVLYNVAQHSLQTRSSVPLAITPLNLDHLKDFYDRRPDPKQSTEFSFSRFLVPYLSGYAGWSLFMDNDMVIHGDIAEVFKLADDRFDVLCTKHNHVPTNATKFLNSPQTQYEKKNWSSFMLFNNARCQRLNLDYVKQASGLDLHQFKWTTEDRIGDIPLEWNHLVGVSPNQNPWPKNFHYTNGGPYFKQECEQPWWWLEEFLWANASADQTTFDITKKAEEFRD